MLSTAIPTLIAATVIVIISKGMPKTPSKPNTEPAVIMFGARAIKVIFSDLKSSNIIKPITLKTKPKDLICDENNDCNILLYKTAKPVT